MNFKERGLMSNRMADGTVSLRAERCVISGVV